MTHKEEPMNTCSVKISCLLLIWGFCGSAFAQDIKDIDVNRLANAIYKAENSKAHPYGILKHYKHTTPRQACINTIKHRLRQWNGKGDFIVFLGLTYSPPKINPYWVRNVKYFYERR